MRARQDICLDTDRANLIKRASVGSAMILDDLRADDALPADPLAASITRRQTNRATCDGRMVPDDVLQILLAEATANIHIHAFARDTPVFTQLGDAIRRGNDVQMNDPAFKAELLSWVRFNKKHAESTGDGLSYAALGAPSLPRWISEPIVKSMLNGKSQNKSDLKKIASSSHLALITSPADDVFSWISTGRALQRFLLSLTRAGIASAYLNQPCEVAEIRGKLREKLFHATREYPQLLLRIGYAKPLPRAGRRPLREVMKSEYGMAY